MKPHKLLSIIWVDAFCERSEWMFESDLAKSAIYKVHSVGHLIREDNNEIVLCQNISQETDHISNCIHIPKGMIRKKTVLKLGV